MTQIGTPVASLLQIEVLKYQIGSPSTDTGLKGLNIACKRHFNKHHFATSPVDVRAKDCLRRYDPDDQVLH